MADSPTEEGFAADAREAFALLGHEIRLDITLALLEQWRAAHTEPQSYSELMRAVGMEDSGKFNYHLDRLRGVYVRQVDEGYVPTAAATALYRTVLGTRPTAETGSETISVDGDCPDCGGPLSGTYERSFLTVACGSCDAVAADFTYPFPANGVDARADGEVVEAVAERAHHHISLARSGQCPFCAGTTTVAVDPEGDLPVEITCDTCSFVVAVQFLVALSREPRVAAALLALGVNMEASPTWEVPRPSVEVSAERPLEVALELDREGRRATVVVDGDLDVRRVTVDGDPLGPGDRA